MKKICLSLFMVLFFATAGLAAPVLKAENNQLYADGKLLPEQVFMVQEVTDSTMKFMAIDQENAAAYKLAGGLYIFDANGKQLAYLATEYAEFCAEVRISPSGKILAMDNGTSLIRDWSFFTFPDMKPIGSPQSYFIYNEAPSLFWNGDKGVVYTYMNIETTRPCEYDPCGYTSVRYYQFDKDQPVTLLAGDDKCDYAVQEVTGNKVVAAKLCMENAQSWKVFPDENLPKETVTVDLP